MQSTALVLLSICLLVYSKPQSPNDQIQNGMDSFNQGMSSQFSDGGGDPMEASVMGAEAKNIVPVVQMVAKPETLKVVAEAASK